MSISKRGLCSECRTRIVNAELDDMKYHRGPYFKAWRRAMVASCGGVLVDDIIEQE